MSEIGSARALVTQPSASEQATTSVFLQCNMTILLAV
jgi:hypothetical protein